MVTALITGASAGIGAVFARTLAAQRYDLVLVARSQDKLASLAEELTQTHGIRAWAIAQDLTQPEAASQIFNAVQQQGQTVDVLINNAGFGMYGAFAAGDRDTLLQMVRLNVLALVDLTHQFLPSMRQRQHGSIINLGSTAAFQPIPYFAVYAATKAFVLSFSEALWVECQADGVHVLALCPGPTETEFFKFAAMPASVAERTVQRYTTPEAVVQAALSGLRQKQSTVVPGGLSNQILVNLPRWLPREAIAQNVGRLFQPD